MVCGYGKKNPFSPRRHGAHRGKQELRKTKQEPKKEKQDRGIYLTPPDATGCGLTKAANGMGAYLHGLLSQSIEQFAVGFGGAAIESKSELVQVIVQMLQSNRTLVGAKQPSFQQRDHTMDAR